MMERTIRLSSTLEWVWSKHTYSVLVLIGITIGLFLIFLASVGVGAVTISPVEVLQIILSRLGMTSGASVPGRAAAILWTIRLPRVLLGILVGSALAISGAAMQGLFRNPLADPSLIGVSSGAALFAAVAILFEGLIAGQLPDFLLRFLIPVCAFTGSLLATMFVYTISTSRGKTNVATMLLAGIAINALSGAGIGYLIFMADDDQLRDITFWQLGSLSGTTWNSLLMTLPFILLAILLLPTLSKALNAMLMGENEARQLGISTERVKRVIIVLVALAIGAAVSVSGVIGFVGLVVPHILRLWIGPDHRFLMPGSAVLGALILIGADLLARTIVAPAVLPIGIVTATLGAPFFLWLLVRNRNLSHHI